MGGILKRLGPVLLFLGCIAAGVQAQTIRELYVYDMDWRGDLIITIALEGSDVKTASGRENGVTTYYTNAGYQVSIDMEKNIPAGTKYDVCATFSSAGSSTKQITLEGFTGKQYVQMGTELTVKVEVTRYTQIPARFYVPVYEIDKSTASTFKIKLDNTAPALNLQCNTSSPTNASTVRVSVSASDSGSGLPAIPIEYSINSGSASYLSSSSGTITLTAEGTHTVYASAKDKFDNTQSKSLTVTIDRTRPVLNVFGLPGGWTNGSVSLGLSASDALSGVNSGSWRCSEDGGMTWQGISAGNLNYAVSREGTTNVIFSVKDYAGNEATESVTVRIDKSLPSISLSGNMGENVWSRDTSRTLTVTAFDSVSGMAVLETRLNNGAWVREANAASASFTYTGEGVFRRAIRATDATGNTAASTSVISLDRHGPVISGFTFPSGWTRPDYLFSGVKVTDSTAASASVSGIDPASFTVTPSGKSSIAVTSGYNASTGALSAFTLPGLPEGSYSLTFSAKDRIGNVSTSVIQTARVDGTAPQISAAAGSVAWKGNSWSIPVTVTVVKEEHSGINPAGWKYRIDGGSPSAVTLSLSNGKYAGEIVVPVLTGGNHSFAVIGVDNAGNESSYQMNIKIDDVPPVIGCDALFAALPENAPWTNVSVLAVSAEDAGSAVREFTAAIKRRLSNGQWAETGDAVFNGTTVTFSEGIPDGVFQFKFRAVDNAANVKEETVYARLDRTGPVISVPSGLSGVSSVTASAEDASSGIEGQSWEWREITGAAAGPWQTGNTAVLPEGKDHVVSFRLKDGAGNWSEKSGEITVDLTSPEISAEVSEYAYRESLGIRISAHDDVTAVKKVRYSLDGGTPREISSWPSVQALIPVEDYHEGVHLLRLSAEDSVAHTGQSEEYAFIIDRTVPEIEAVDVHSKLEPERLLGDLDFSGGAEVTVKVHGSDWYDDRGTDYAGKITAWYRYVIQDKDSIPAFADSGKEPGPEFNVGGLKEGPNYVYFRTEDAGGNFSEVFRRIVSVDLAIPASPIIRSTTHPEARAAEQAFPFSTAEFSFRPPVNILSGIKRYQWRLERVFIYGGIAGNGEIVERGSTEKLNASLEGKLSLTLEDNRENEFYRLFVSCTASNGNVSEESVYQFRIDTASPNEVRVITVPQIDRGEWYRDTSSLVMWNQPADMTGVA
jgi:hypothetical protein